MKPYTWSCSAALFDNMSVGEPAGLLLQSETDAFYRADKQSCSCSPWCWTQNQKPSTCCFSDVLMLWLSGWLFFPLSFIFIAKQQINISSVWWQAQKTCKRRRKDHFSWGTNSKHLSEHRPVWRRRRNQKFDSHSQLEQEFPSLDVGWHELHIPLWGCRDKWS